MSSYLIEDEKKYFGQLCVHMSKPDVWMNFFFFLVKKK